jgi:drug/metabolite transporter (DMT)-like permease
MQNNYGAVLYLFINFNTFRVTIKYNHQITYKTTVNGISKDFLQLNLIMLLNSFLPLVVKNISIPSVEIVFYRTLAAFLLLGVFLYFKKISFNIGTKEVFLVLFSGLLTSAYSILLFVSAKLSTLSVCLVGMATSSVWISILQPVVFRTKNQPLQELLSINAVIGLYIIFNSGFEYGWGLTIGITASFFGAMLTIVTSRLARKHTAYTVTFYQMAGAWLGTALFLPFYSYYFTKGQGLKLGVVSGMDLSLIFALAFVFSIYAYSVMVRCMRTIPPFVVALIANLSPVYGIVFDLLFMGKNEMMNSGFYLGTALLLTSVFAYPVFSYYMKKHEEEVRRQTEAALSKEADGRRILVEDIQEKEMVASAK